MYIGGASPLGSLPVALSSRALWLSCAARFAVRRTQSRRLAQRARRSGLDLVCACGAAFALSARRVAWVSIEAQLYGWLENRTECGFEVGSDQLATLGVHSVVICYLCLIAFLLGEGVSSVSRLRLHFGGLEYGFTFGSVLGHLKSCRGNHICVFGGRRGASPGCQ